MNTVYATGTKITVRVEEKDLVFSGFVHLDQPKAEVEFDGLILEFMFLTDGGQSRYETTAESQTKLIFKLYNHFNSLSEGIYSPIEIGHHNKRKLYITYVVSTVNKEENKRRFEFAFYVGAAL